MGNLKIAILGATSNIARGLISNFLLDSKVELHLYTRSPEKLKIFFDALHCPNQPRTINVGYQEFGNNPYDVIINCIGVGTRNKLQGDYTLYLTVTEEYDNMVIKYLCNICPNAIYISFSSGVVYGGEFLAPAEEDTKNIIPVNHIKSEEYYTIARLNSETKHRSFNHLNIVDLRIFSYFSRYSSMGDSYFITDVMNSILNNKILITDNVNIVRDFIHPQDLYSMICQCIAAKRINSAFDVSSSKPVEKREIINYFASEYGLKYEIGWAANHASPTGVKNNYYSRNNKSFKFGYKPVYSSMDAIKDESGFILSQCIHQANQSPDLDFGKSIL
ncbi:MAG: NAD(P)-dependent oxidoreductase [Candidatus Magasanikbacteria bacterium]